MSKRILIDALKLRSNIEDDFHRFVGRSGDLLFTMFPGDHNRAVREAVKKEFLDAVLAIQFPSVLEIARKRFPAYLPDDE